MCNVLCRWISAAFGIKSKFVGALEGNSTRLSELIVFNIESNLILHERCSLSYSEQFLE